MKNEDINHKFTTVMNLIDKSYEERRYIIKNKIEYLRNIAKLQFQYKYKENEWAPFILDSDIKRICICLRKLEMTTFDKVPCEKTFYINGEQYFKEHSEWIHWYKQLRNAYRAVDGQWEPVWIIDSQKVGVLYEN